VKKLDGRVSAHGEFVRTFRPPLGHAAGWDAAAPPRPSGIGHAQSQYFRHERSDLARRKKFTTATTCFADQLIRPVVR